MSGKYMSVYAIGIARYETKTPLSKSRHFHWVEKLQISRNNIDIIFLVGDL